MSPPVGHGRRPSLPRAGSAQGFFLLEFFLPTVAKATTDKADLYLHSHPRRWATSRQQLLSGKSIFHKVSFAAPWAA